VPDRGRACAGIPLVLEVICRHLLTPAVLQVGARAALCVRAAVRACVLWAPLAHAERLRAPGVRLRATLGARVV